jgi:hypothetical protein
VAISMPVWQCPGWKPVSDAPIALSQEERGLWGGNVKRIRRASGDRRIMTAWPTSTVGALLAPRSLNAEHSICGGAGQCVPF